LDQSAVERIVRREIEPLKEKLGLRDWGIKVHFDLKSESIEAIASGECNWLIDYEKATIRLAPAELETEEEVIEVLRHEMFHIVLAPISIYANAIRPALEGDAARRAMAESVFTHAVERMVINLERMYRGLTAGAPQAPPVARERRK
jgi:hypothetical protein